MRSKLDLHLFQLILHLYMKKNVVNLLAVLLLISTGAIAQSASQSASAAATRTINYYSDRQVVVPQTVTRVASAWEAQNSIIAMLGYGPQIVATTRHARDMPAFRKFLPGIKDVPLAGNGSGDLNVEELMRLRTQLLFVSSPPAPAQAAQLQRAGIAVASFRSNSISALVERTLISGRILGPDAEVKALRYKAYFDDNVARVGKALATIPSKQRVSLYHSVSGALRTSGRPSLNQDWMDLAYVRNVAEEWFSTKGPSSSDVSIEQIVAADPDIILTMLPADAQQIRTDPRWRQLRAVKSGRVYTNPRGMFWWCRETSETALQFLWLAKLAYPEQMKHIDMRAETRRFYQEFYGYRLSDTEIDEFLTPSSS